MRNLIKLHSRAPLAVRLLTYYFLLIILLPLVEQYVIDAYVASEFYWIKPAIELSVRVAFGISLFWVFRTVDWKLNAAQGHASESTRLLLERLAMASALRAMGSNPHSERISRYAALVAEELGLPADQVEIVRSAAALHDVGKLAIPDRILLKPGVLTPEQRELMQEHVFYGADLLAGGNEPVMQAAYNIALTVEVNGPLDIARAVESVYLTIRRAEALHVRFAVGADEVLRQHQGDREAGVDQRRERGRCKLRRAGKDDAHARILGGPARASCGRLWSSNQSAAPRAGNSWRSACTARCAGPRRPT